VAGAEVMKGAGAVAALVLANATTESVKATAHTAGVATFTIFFIFSFIFLSFKFHNNVSFHVLMVQK
jgi:hypothetical protein